MTKRGKNWLKDKGAEWLSNVIKLHDMIIEKFGGAKGIIDMRLLEATLERPFMGLANGTKLFPSDIEKASAILEGLINFHPFVDGNKRTATTFTFEFLREHSYKIEVSDKEIVDVVTKIATKKMNFHEIRNWIAKIATH